MASVAGIGEGGGGSIVSLCPDLTIPVHLAHRKVIGKTTERTNRRPIAARIALPCSLHLRANGLQIAPNGMHRNPGDMARLTKVTLRRSPLTVTSPLRNRYIRPGAGRGPTLDRPVPIPSLSLRGWTGVPRPSRLGMGSSHLDWLGKASRGDQTWERATAPGLSPWPGAAARRVRSKALAPPQRNAPTV